MYSIKEKHKADVLEILFSVFFYKLCNPLKRHFYFINARRVAPPYVSLTAKTEHIARYNSNSTFLTQLSCKLRACQSRRSNIGEHVERTIQLRNRKTHVAERFVHKITALLIAYPHALNFAPAVLESFHCSVLRKNRSADSVVLMQLYNLRHKFFRSSDVTDSPAGHCK